MFNASQWESCSFLCSVPMPLDISGSRQDQIFGSSYFKSLLDISDLDPLTEEIAKYVGSTAFGRSSSVLNHVERLSEQIILKADTLDVYNSGNNVHPSCFICQAGVCLLVSASSVFVLVSPPKDQGGVRIAGCDILTRDRFRTRIHTVRSIASSPCRSRRTWMSSWQSWMQILRPRWQLTNCPDAFNFES